MLVNAAEVVMSPDYFVQLLTYDIQNQPSESAPTHPQCSERIVVV